MTALTVLISVVAVASSEPLRGTAGDRGQTRPEAATPVRAASDFPVPGALPPEVFPPEAEAESVMPGWLLWVIAVIAVTALLGAGMVLVRALRSWWGARRRTAGRTLRQTPRASLLEPTAEDGDEDVEVARRAVDAALARLQGSAGPRAAVIEAYARMEEVLTERELGRQAPEAPREYLGRVLRRRGMPEQSLTSLTALFEEARFSLHPISESASSRAQRDLEDAQSALAAKE